MTSRTLRLFLATSALAFALSACEGNIDTRGNLPSADKVSQIRAGKMNKDDVATLLGTPSTVTTFGDNVWYYVGSRQESWAYRQAEELERTVVAVEFDKKNIVKEVRVKGLADGQPVELVQRETPSAGREMTLLQQLLGNVGRFTGGKKAGAE